jgi:hypothetical protein
MTIDPRVGAWCNFIALVLSLVGAGTVVFAGLPDATNEIIKTWALNGFAIMSAANVVFHLYDTPSVTPTGLKRMTAPPQP